MRAAATLYTRAAREIAPLLDDRQRVVVRGAIAALDHADESSAG